MRYICILGMTLALSACQSLQHFRLDRAYDRAVAEAKVRSESSRVDDLRVVVSGDPDLVWDKAGERILVVTWKAKGAFENFIEPYQATSDQAEYVVWVTLAPEVRETCRSFAATGSADIESLNLRLRQYLGLSPHWTYDLFVEMWVDPKDLFRPCVDPETDDTSCNLAFGDTVPVVKNIADYPAFFHYLEEKSFNSGSPAPWTGMGYTYDWAFDTGRAETKVGASEFILVPEAAYEIHRAVPTADYCL